MRWIVPCFTKSFFVGFLVALSALFAVSGCSHSKMNTHRVTAGSQQKDHTIDGNVVIVKERVNSKESKSGFDFKLYKEINSSKKISEIKRIVANIHWSKGMPSMATVEDYRFHFKNMKGDVTSERYKMWISPTGKNIELLTLTHYVQLNPSKSEALFNLLTGKHLPR